MNVKEACTKRFSCICKEKGISYNELANISGITPSTVYSMMDDRRKDLSIITIKKLCDGLDLTLSEFFDSEIFYKLTQELV